MTGDGEATEAAPARVRRWRRRAAIATLSVVIAGGGLAWIERNRLADSFLRDQFERRGVAARYRVVEIGFHRQRIADVVIGDPRRPDLSADWIEIQTGFGLTGPTLRGVRIGRMRVRGRIVDGALSLGSIDRLLPAGSGGGFTLPAIFVALNDARLALATSQGAIDLALRGSGRLDDGFDGTLSLASQRLAYDRCQLTGTSGQFRLRVVRRQPRLSGAATLGDLACGDLRAQGLALGGVDLTLGDSLQRWRGSVGDASAGALLWPGGEAHDLHAGIGFDGDARRTGGTLELTAGRSTMRAGAQGLGLQTAGFRGKFAVGAEGGTIEGDLSATGAALDPRWRAAIGPALAGLDGTPLAPIAGKLLAAAGAASRAFALQAHVAGAMTGQGGEARLGALSIRSASGANVSLAGEAPIRLRWPQGDLALDGELALSGGGFPSATLKIRQPNQRAPMQGELDMRPYAAGDALLALDRVRFRRSPGGSGELGGRAMLSGPIGAGRIERLRLPLLARWNGQGAIQLNPGCTPIAFDRLDQATLRIDGTALEACATRGAALAWSRAGLSGGVTLGETRFAGAMGDAPLEVSLHAATLDLAERRFALTAPRVAIGPPDRVTRLEIGQLDGAIDSEGLSGKFTSASGQIGAVPLLLGDARGDWTFRSGRLDLAGALDVADAADVLRFHRLTSDDVRLSLQDGRIQATGTLHLPGRNESILAVTLAHDLGAATGDARLEVARLHFASDGLQPSDITPLTFGVVAAVEGDVAGSGQIHWSPEQLVSSGDFHTDGLNLAAAFGPVTGIRTAIHFSDLLGLATADYQTARIAQLNPGIPVENGTIRYRLLGAGKVEVEQGVWPFAGGELRLEPTMLDFVGTGDRLMTFKVSGVQAGQFLQQMAFTNLDATGTFDGELPMIFDAAGGRIEKGALRARSGGSLAYVGELSQRDLGVWGNFAFQALKSLQYRDLSIQMNGPLDGEMITQVHFAGLSQGKGAKSNFLFRQIERLPFVFNVTIRAPFRQLVDSVQSYYDPRLLVERNLPALLEQQQATPPVQPVQPKESVPVP